MSVIATATASLELTNAALPLLKELYRTIKKSKINISYDGILNDKVSKWKQVQYPKKEQVVKENKLNVDLIEYSYKVISSAISSEKNVLANLFIPTPIIAVLGIHFSKKVKVVNNESFRQIRANPFMKKNEWVIKKHSEENKIFICDNSSIPSKGSGLEISLKSDKARGAIKHKCDLVELKKMVSKNSTGKQELNLYLECSPAAAYAVGEALQKLSIKKNLFHFDNVSKSYHRLVTISENNVAKYIFE